MSIESPQYDWLRRGARTFFQAFVGTLSVMAIPALTDVVRAIGNAEPYELNFDLWQSIIIAAALSGVIALISFAQNALEDSGKIPAVGKAIPSSGENPVPEPETPSGYDPMRPETWPSPPKPDGIRVTRRDGSEV